MTINQEVATLVTKAMLEAERSRKWTAEKAGMSYTTFVRKLNGGPDFTIGEISRIALVLRVDAIGLLPAEFHPTITQAAA